MTKPIPHPPATRTREEGIAIADETIRIINTEEDLTRDFISSVHRGLVGMRARLRDGAYFTAGMERTLMNWSRTIGPGKQTTDGAMLM